MKLNRIIHLLITPLLAFVAIAQDAPPPAPQEAAVKDIAIAGGVDGNGKARITIEGTFGGPKTEPKVILSTGVRQWLKVTREKVHSHIEATITVLQGAPEEIALTLGGEGEIKEVTGEALLDWGIRQQPDGARTLILRPKKGDKPLEQLNVTIIAVRDMKAWKSTVAAFTVTPPNAGLFSGFLRLESAPEFNVKAEGATGLLPMERKYLPEPMQGALVPDEAEPLAFRFHGTAYSLPLTIEDADPESRRVVLRDFNLTGQLTGQTASFLLTATARVANPNGGSIPLISGGAALTELPKHPDWRVGAGQDGYVLSFDKPGEYPLSFKFSAAVRQSDSWNAVDFRVATSGLLPVVLQGLAADTQFDFAGAAKPERVGNEFTSFLPPGGAVKLAWKNKTAESEGRLFYASEMLSQISISPGLMRQVAIIDSKVMQGELSSVGLVLRGAGEITRVLGDGVLAWDVKPGTNDGERVLNVQFNQPQKGAFTLHVQTQTPIDAFPQAVDVLEMRPENATRFAGYFRIVNDGAVRLEVVESKGLSQVSPEQFPETDATKAVLRVNENAQRFAYRFSGAEFALRIAADQIQPELTVSQILAYHHGETELTVEAEFEVDIREAPLRELLIHMPKGYAVAKLAAPGMVDYFQRDVDANVAELRIVYGQPVAGRQVVQLRIEQNKALGTLEWVLPRVEVQKVKSVRGHLAASADAGFRLTPSKTQALTEIATAFFPRKLPGLQTAFRLSDPAWEATLTVERLPQSIQVDALNLFSIGEGVAYGSSVLNYVITGSPIASFKVELSGEYSNVEFSGKDIRSWEKAEGGFVVQLHTPVSGAYTLLATYERVFKEQGDTLSFAGARPLDAQSEQGHTIVISAYQFQVKPVNISPGLLPLETGEVPSEYRLFFDAPILAAYRYSARPFDLKLELSPLAQGDSISQIVDRASLTTQISKEGQVLTDAQYFVKNRGNTHFRIVLPTDTQLWSASVNGASVVPVTDGDANLIPLPQQADPNAALDIKLKLASRSKDARLLTVETPTVAAPVMLAEWKLSPDTAQRLSYRGGSLTPTGGAVDLSGFAGITRLLENEPGETIGIMIGAIGLLVLSVLVWRSGTLAGVHRNTTRHSTALIVGALAFLFAIGALFILAAGTGPIRDSVPSEISFLAPVQQPDTSLTATVSNIPVEDGGFHMALSLSGFLALLAIGAWVYAWVGKRPPLVPVGWLLIAWAALQADNGERFFFPALGAFALVHIAIPAIRRLMKVPMPPKNEPAPPLAESGGSLAAVLLLGALSLFFLPVTAQEPPNHPPVAETFVQEIRVDENFAFATAKIHWPAEKGQKLPVLFEPAVMTKAVYPEAGLKLVQNAADRPQAHYLLALESGSHDVELQYQFAVTTNDKGTGLVLPSGFGLVNTLTLTLSNLDVDVYSPQAVSVDRKAVGKDTVATLILGPTTDIWIGWKPRSRDVAKETAVFHAELTQLAIPTAGVVEGLSHISIKPAQGELAEMVFTVPDGTTITDVIDPLTLAPAEDKVSPSIVSQWRFDPDAGKLRVSLTPRQSRPFGLLVRSQIATGPLPVTQTVGLLSSDGAASEIGMFGVATGNEVQLDTVTAGTLTSINLEDYPVNLAASLASQIPGLTVRRAFRYADPKATAAIAASAVEPDVRVESQDTLSLGEDRVLLAVNASVEITRAGIFRLSFAQPAGMDVESITGEAVSHWTESKDGDARIITLHLRGRTEGRQEFAITLTGPGLKAQKGWKAPQLVFREAGKQRGTIVVVPEQGMRLQVSTREGVTQLDPQKSGIKEKGVLAFRVLQTPWNLTVDVEQVDAWVQVTSLQHALVGEAQVKVTANLQYEIENTGLKSFNVALPADAENVHFSGDNVSDFIAAKDAVNAGMQAWEVKLGRRVIGQYMLQVTYQTAVAVQAPATNVTGVQTAGVNLQRGFVTVQSGGRLQLSVDALPEALQPAEWQSIPRTLQKDLAASSASFAYRLVEPAFVLPLKIQRHEAAKLLPARVNNITLKSVIADSGAMLTEVTMEMIPGDKRLLSVRLPKDARFWFAYVNQNGVWPWREGEQILIPLEQQSHGSEAIPVTLFYSSQIGEPGRTSLDLQLLAPKFDLPLENIVWNVYLNNKWDLKDWTGSLQKQADSLVAATQTMNVQMYLEGEVTQKREKTKAAEQQLQLGNKMLELGDQQQARRAFGNAYGLSQHDMAFNEDARVQLHNLKLQQALVGLNIRKNETAGNADPLASKLRAAGTEPNYSQQEAKQLLDNNSADDNAALTKLAERLIEQQDAAVSAPAVIQASIPEQGRLITFSRSVAVDTQADLQIELNAKSSGTAPPFTRVVILAITGLLLALGVLSVKVMRMA
ncbi:MAG: hypothetical protein ACKV19_12505 [Verrucomicrobiales bacterium]